MVGIKTKLMHGVEQDVSCRFMNNNSVMHSKDSEQREIALRRLVLCLFSFSRDSPSGDLGARPWRDLVQEGTTEGLPEKRSHASILFFLSPVEPDVQRTRG